jgi:uroporphyrinogen-III synthase
LGQAPTADARLSGRWSQLWVTRPHSEAILWAEALTQAGWPVKVLPLIRVGPPADLADRAALVAARVRAPACDAILFVSTPAVQHFFEGLNAAHWAGATTRFWAPGPATARALSNELRRLGIDSSRIDQPPAGAAQFDSEHLWPVVAPQVGHGRRVLVVRGTSGEAPGAGLAPGAGQGREWLLDRCRAAGAEVSSCAAYERRPPDWTPQMVAEARSGAAAGQLWLFSSSEALMHLMRGLPGTDWSRSGALCTHPRIAQAAREAGFGEVLESRPVLKDVLAALESDRGTS